MSVRWRSSVVSRFIATTLGLLAIATSTATAQRVAGIGDDAISIPRGSVRFRIAATWSRHDELFRPDANGSMDRRPLLERANLSALDSRALPQLAPVEAAIKTLTGLNSLQIGLGSLEARGEVQHNVTPISIDYGITNRLSIGLLVPYVEVRTTTQFVLNREMVGANVGQNPAYTASGSLARTANGLLLRQLSESQQQLAAEITRCADAGAAGCDAVRSNPQGAQQLLARALQVEGALATVYGDSVRGGSFVAPIAGSSTQAAVASTIGALRNQFASFGVTALGEATLPVGATTVYGTGGFGRIVGDTALGLGYTSMGNTRHSGIGDIDLTGTFLIFDTFGASQARRLAPTGTNVRSTVTAGWRFGSANAQRTNDPLELPTGEGAPALLARSTTDLIFGQRFWVSATARLTKPMTDRVALAYPFVTDSTLLHPFTVVEAERALGMRMQFEIAPRYALGEFFGVSAAYQMQRIGEDRFDVGATGPPSSGVLTIPSRNVQAIAIGFTYSSLASYSRGRSRLPVEVIISHSEPLTASGGIVPAVSTDRLEFRIYTGFPRR